MMLSSLLCEESSGYLHGDDIFHFEDDLSSCSTPPPPPFSSPAHFHPENNLTSYWTPPAPHCSSPEIGYSSPLAFSDSIALLMSQQSLGRYLPSDVYVEELGALARSSPTTPARYGPLADLRRGWALWILQLQNLFRLDVSVAGSAVSMLDRFVSSQNLRHHHYDMKLVATACLWLAAKYKDSHALDILRLQDVPEIQYDARSVQRMELTVLRTLGWSAVTLTPHDFISNVIQELCSTNAFPGKLVQYLNSRADELVAGLLPDAAFVKYQPSVISTCVLQCVLDESVPLLARSVMDSLRRTLPVDMISAWDCYQLLTTSIIDPDFSVNLPSPNHVADVYPDHGSSVIWNPSLQKIWC